MNSGLDIISDELLAAISPLVPEGRYLPALVSTQPRLVLPSGEGDYFANEQVEHRGINGFWGLPESARTPYYRASEWQRDGHDNCFEFIVPMVPPSWNDRDQVSFYEQVLPLSDRPTVLALSILDRTHPFDSFDAHSGLIHFVLDGHHKIQAAATLGAPIRMLTLLAIDHSLERPEICSSVFDTFA